MTTENPMFPGPRVVPIRPESEPPISRAVLLGPHLHAIEEIEAAVTFASGIKDAVFGLGLVLGNESSYEGLHRLLDVHMRELRALADMLIGDSHE
jgi:hypothetical protein